MFEIWTDASGELIYTDQGYYSPRVGSYDSDTLYHESRARDPKLTLEVTKAGSLSFTINQNDQSLVLNRGDVVYVKRTTDDKIIWAGRILSEERDSNNDRIIECEGALAYLIDILQPETKVWNEANRPTPTGGGSRPRAIDYLNLILNYYNSFKDSNSSLRFSSGEIKEFNTWQSLNAYMEFHRTRETTYNNIQRELLDRAGGQIRVRHIEENNVINNIIDCIDAYDEERGSSLQTVEFGKNLVSITRRVTVEDFATCYIPQGASLSEIDKSWPYIIRNPNGTTLGSGTYKIVPYERAVQNDVQYRWGKYIDSETGVIASTSSNTFAVCQDIEVYPGEKFYFTTRLEGPPTIIDNNYVGALTYAIVCQTNNTEVLLASGRQAKNSKHTENGQTITETAIVNISDEAIEIPYPDSSLYPYDHLYLRVARTLINGTATPFKLKKVNPYYAEEYVTIASEVTHTPTDAFPIGKDVSITAGDDIYPKATSSNAMMEQIEASKLMYHRDLVNTFGKIYKVFSAEDETDPEELYSRASLDLYKMSEKVEIEIQAVDLSYIDPTLPPFELLDLVHVISEPHAIDVLLPITKIELPLAEPEKAIYTLTNDVSVKGKGPIYISQYMAETYKKV